MAVKKVDLYVSQILEDLDNGLTWLKRDDLGYGSIQDKYGAKDQQIAMIRKHPALKDAETNVTVFNVIDDTKDERSSIPVSRPETDRIVERVPESRGASSGAIPTILPDSNKTGAGAPREASPTASDELAAFVNL